MKVEVLHASGGAKCPRELDGLRAAARQANSTVDWKELDILQVLDYAVELGVLSPRRSQETMPTDACQFFYECARCKQDAAASVARRLLRLLVRAGASQAASSGRLRGQREDAGEARLRLNTRA